MHIRDEHIQKETKVRMKRMFIKRTETAQPPILTPKGPPVAENVIDPQLLEASIDDTPFQPWAAQPQSNDCFRDMAARHALSAEEDKTDCEPVAAASVIGRSVRLVELFNFTDSHWVQVYEQAAQQSFDEELELYELLDLDAKGKEEANVDIDNSTRY